MRVAIPLFALLLVSGCARAVSTTPSLPAAPPPAVPVDADALIAGGCYRCLEVALRELDARDPESRRVSAAPPLDPVEGLPAVAIREASFQVAALLALRSKELGLPFKPWIDRAAAAMPAGMEWPLYLEIVTVVRIDPLSGDREEILNATAAARRPAATVQQWRDALTAGRASPLFRAYLDLTLACSVGQQAQAIADAEQRFGGIPLIEYRIGTCASPRHLVALREAHDDFADADLPLGRNALESTQPDQEEALRLFRSARVAFPDSPVIAASIGEVHRDREEWREALEAFDAALALVPTHRDALLGRTIALSNLSRHEEAIASATRLLDLGSWFVGGAYFWRAWNQYTLGNIPAARADVDQARMRGSAPATLVLAGMVAWRQQQLAAAEKDFQDALDMDRGQCEAAALQGAVRAARTAWPDAIASFQHATQCFGLTIALRRKLIDDIEAGPGTPAGKASQAARHERAIAEAEKNRDDALTNVAAIQKRLNPSSR